MAGPPQLRLDDALYQVLEAQIALARAQMTPGGLLDGITDVVKGSRARVRPDPPYLWTTVARAAADDTTHTLHERWVVTTMLSAFVASEDPQEGWVDAMQWASRFRSSVLTEQRDLGLDFVSDTQSRGLEPIGQITSGRKFGAFARLDVIFTILEPPQP